jgi:hypothetical protein
MGGGELQAKAPAWNGFANSVDAGGYGPLGLPS